MFHEQKDADSKGYYITTAIDYPNAPPHIGHSLEKVAADVVARFHRLQGHDTYFSIGLDENSQHVVRAAEANGSGPTTWVNKMSEVFQQAWSGLDISYDYWIRTTQERHFRASQELFRRAQREVTSTSQCTVVGTVQTATHSPPMKNSLKASAPIIHRSHRNSWRRRLLFCAQQV